MKTRYGILCVSIVLACQAFPQDGPFADILERDFCWAIGVVHGRSSKNAGSPTN